MQHSFQSADFYLMPKAFISYARDGGYGENLAAEIQQQLLAAGFAVFRDVIGLKPGDVWYRTLEFELETSDVMVLVVSEKVRTSKWVHNEVSMAEEIGIPVIPVLAEKVRYPLWLRHLQVLDFCGVVDWTLLLGALGHHVGSGAVEVREKGKRCRAGSIRALCGFGGEGHYPEVSLD
ncbi:MAG: hypothetical protein BWK73_23405 [Thiothrix lacustris]|uniref:TIR domain-containing protein n=1 Tax=Thiothrix lacustris TaxID=525917 RepID=A0A1Y1QMB4_9GAMM|nr:MAG: hypothetical protein BWK73_23405 [Thiothrix lacustris]